jgi:hypothetical protein
MSNIAVNMEDFACKAKLEIPNFTGIKFSSKVLPDMIGVSIISCATTLMSVKVLEPRSSKSGNGMSSSCRPDMEQK